MAKQLSTSLAPYKIRVNALAPGFFPTAMTQVLDIMKGPDPRVEGNVSADVSPLERSGSEVDIQGLILFLVSRAGAYIDGCVCVIDGGRLSTLPADY